MIKTRFAPSPTGYLHIGGLRTALYSYLFAKQNNGHFILRIEDTDQTRFVEGATESLIRTLEWAGLAHDEGPGIGGPHGPYIQSERTELYRTHANQLLQNGHAYRCFCSIERLDQMREAQQAKKMAPMYDKHCLTRPQNELNQLLEQNVAHVIRLNVPPNETLRFRDLIRGDMQIDSNTVDDQVLMKSDGFPTYHLANVVDDHAMEITHVIRGEEWLPSTPKHIYLYKAFGWDMPKFAHIPLLLNKDKSKLSKRQNDVAVEDYIQKGYLKEAVLNFIALLGWHPGEGETQEVFTLQELIERFSLEKVHKAGAVFNLERLDWFNANALRALSPGTFLQALTPWMDPASLNGLNPKAIRSVQERIKTLSEAPEQFQIFLAETLDYDLDLLQHEKMNVTRDLARTALTTARDDLTAAPPATFDSEESIKELLTHTIEKLGLKNGQVLWPLRVALTGQAFSPGAFEMIILLGKIKTLDRIDQTLRRLQ